MNARAYQHLLSPLQAHQGHIEHAFDIPSIKVLPTLVKFLNIQLAEGEELGLLTFLLTYREVSPLEYGRWKLLDLPEDMEREIYSYLKSSTVLTFQVDFRNRWPFRSPRVTVLSDTSSYGFSKVIHRYNCDLQAEWSPALGFEKTVLMLLVRILDHIQFA